MGINESLIRKCEYLFFEGVRNKRLFQKPHLLIAERTEGLAIPAVYCERDLVFSNQIIGVHAPERDADELREFARRLGNTPTYAALLALFSSRWLVKRNNSVLKRDIVELPYPEDEKELELAWWEEILVRDVFEFAIPFRNLDCNSRAIAPVKGDELQRFGKLYSQFLNSVYDNFTPLNPVRCGDFICYPFCYGEEPDIAFPDGPELIHHIENLARGSDRASVTVTRVIRFYNENVIFMIKPNQKRFWLQSIAIRDADETLADLWKQGY